MTEALRVGIAGLGTVGAGTLKILTERADLLAERCGRAIKVVAVSARNKGKDRGIRLDGFKWVENPIELANDPAIDLIVENIGGSEGVARRLVEAALTNGKAVVTANKALIAHHGVQLARLAEEHNAVLAFEAAVAGGIPIIKSLRDGLSANRFRRIAGILNGTCNYILTTMWEAKYGFDEVLKDAQARGYAEAEPSFDIDGIDTAHKIAILASLAYGTPPAIDKVYVEGIRGIRLRDMEFADELGYAIKLLGVATMTERGLQQRVHPCMVRKDSPLGAVGGVYNAVQVEGDACGTVLFEGHGAGAGPTASSVVADILDIARGVNYKPLTLAVKTLKKINTVGMEALRCSYYLRLAVIDEPGVLAEITALFKKEKISLRSFIQHSHNPEETVQLVLTTHETPESAMLSAVKAIGALGSVTEPPCMIRIEHL
ncbi:MAG: homoserine dehydrogenase [Phycisphaeraceae bacterium]|nr:homoserine dehydrogenase [Phycisphaeraceae bacterium]